MYGDALIHNMMLIYHFDDSVSGPDKAGVGGSIPSLATNPFNNLAAAKKACKTFSRAQYAHMDRLTFTFGAARSNHLHVFRAGHWSYQ